MWYGMALHAQVDSNAHVTLSISNSNMKQTYTHDFAKHLVQFLQNWTVNEQSLASRILRLL